MAETQDVVLSEIGRILSEELSLPGPFTLGQHLIADLGLDSLGLTVLAVELENRFRIHLSMDESAEIGTVEDLIWLVVEAGKGQSASLREGGFGTDCLDSLFCRPHGAFKTCH